MSAILYAGLFAYHLLLPGWLAARWLGLRRGRFLFSVAGSYSLAVGNLVWLEWMRAPAWVFAALFFLETAALAAVEWRRCRRQPPRGAGARARLPGDVPRQAELPFGAPAGAGAAGEGGPPAGAGAGPGRNRRRGLRVRRLGPVLWLAAGVALYLAWAGPYLELPGDSCEHLGRIVAAGDSLAETGRLAPLALPGAQSGAERASSLLVPRLSDLLSRQGCHWYILQALLCRWSGLPIAALPGPLTLANTLVYCMGLYVLALWVWAGRRHPRFRIERAALAAVAFSALWLGVSVFAYIRYYALAPCMLNASVCLAVIVIGLEFLRTGRWRHPAVWLAPLWVWTLMVTHTQEAAFAFFMGLGILLVLEGRWLGQRVRRVRGPAPAFPVSRIKLHVLLALALGAYGVLVLEALGRPPARLPAPIFTPLLKVAPLALTWFIQSPHGPFYQVLTGWGLFVTLLFFVRAREFEGSPFLLAGMLMPVLTVFNPLSLTLLARWVPDVQALYRFSYLMPLPLIAGWLAVRFWSELAAARDSRPRLNGQRARTAACLLGLAGLLMPWEHLLGGRSNSRLFTLRPVPPANDLRYWGDLIAELQARPDSCVVTDPYTRVFLRWMNIRVASWKVFRRLADATAVPWSAAGELDPGMQWLLAVNRRAGAFSPNGARSGHWPGDVLQRFPDFYPDPLLEGIRRNPRRFHPLWARDGITLYEIVRPP